MCQLMDHGAACGKGFVSEQSCRNHACRTTAEQQQLTLLASCRVQHKSIGNYLPQTPKKIDSGSNSKLKFDPKNEAILASPNEIIEAVSQKLKLKNDFCQKRHKLSKTKRNVAAPKKNS